VGCHGYAYNQLKSGISGVTSHNFQTLGVSKKNESPGPKMKVISDIASSACSAVCLERRANMRL
jgi:hypothetical protein